MFVHTCTEWTRAEKNWRQHKSLNAFTHARSRNEDEAEAKSAAQQRGPTPNYPSPFPNFAPQTIFTLTNMADPPARQLRMCEHTHANVAGMSKSTHFHSAGVSVPSGKKPFELPEVLNQCYVMLHMGWGPQGVRDQWPDLVCNTGCCGPGFVALWSDHSVIGFTSYNNLFKQNSSKSTAHYLLWVWYVP